MAEHSIQRPRYAHRRTVVALIALIVLPSICAAWLNGWSFFSFPLGTFLIWLGVPFGLVAAVLMIPLAEDEEATDP